MGSRMSPPADVGGSARGRSARRLLGGVLWPVTLAVGAVTGRAIVASVLRGTPRHPLLFAVPALVLAACTVAGLLIGSLLALAVSMRSTGSFRCPRCGTPSTRGVLACRACDLPFG